MIIAAYLTATTLTKLQQRAEQLIGGGTENSADQVATAAHDIASSAGITPQQAILALQAELKLRCRQARVAQGEYAELSAEDRTTLTELINQLREMEHDEDGERVARAFAEFLDRTGFPADLARHIFEAQLEELLADSFQRMELVTNY